MNNLIGTMKKEQDIYPRTRRSHSPLVFLSRGQTQDWWVEVRLGDTKAGGLIGHTPETDDLTDRFENVDELILCGRGEQGGCLGDSGRDVPRPCCTGHFRLPRGVSGHEARLRAGRVWLTEDDFTHCGEFVRTVDQCDRD